MAETRHFSRTYSKLFSNDIVVGIEDKLYRIKDRLTGYSSKLDVLSIVGMGGIGKTTIARKTYDDPLLADHFYVRAWTTLSQKYELVDILLGLMQQFGHGDIRKIGDLGSSRAVGELLWKGLKNRRYLVVIDDIWDVEAWKTLRIFFPDDCTGSRIILTSRNVEVAEYANPNYPPYELSLMDPETSWELLSMKVFLKDSFPEELVSIGNAISLKCQGLALAISVVAGHLSKVGRTYTDWHNVENQLPSIHGNVLDILALSYNYLPVHLQKCFLFAASEYAKAFRLKSLGMIENKIFRVPTKKLMLLWIAAGYIHAESPRSLEDVAEKYLHELTSRNLVVVTNRGSCGRSKSYIVHDLMIDMYMRLDGESAGRLDNYSHGLYPFAFFGYNEYDTDRFLQSSGLNRSHLKYLEVSYNRPLPTSVYKFHNLQTVINIESFPGETLPRDIWMLVQLRHLHVGDMTYLPSPRRSHTEEFVIPVMKNLQSVTLSSASCTREICETIPNLRRLKLYEKGTECNVEEQSVNCLNNLFFRSRLQSLRLSLQDPPRCLRHWKSPPPSLRKLTLEGTCLAREDIMILASLPNLEVLKLKYESFEMWRWIMAYDDDIFYKLRFLLLECPYLDVWEANCNNFPNLQHLVLRNCYYLKRIPLEMADICTLQVIELDDCGLRVEESARAIQLEQCDMGNEDFEVQVRNEHWQGDLPVLKVVDFNTVIMKPHIPIPTVLPSFERVSYTMDA